MFSNAMATLPVVDMQRARKFYGETLGLNLADENPGGVAFACEDGTHVFLYERGATKADHTALGLQVDNLEVTMGDLKAKGVAFEEYDEPIKAVDGVVTTGSMKGAWLKDTEGNIIGLIQL